MRVFEFVPKAFEPVPFPFEALGVIGNRRLLTLQVEFLPAAVLLPRIPFDAQGIAVGAGGRIPRLAGL